MIFNVIEITHSEPLYFLRGEDGRLIPAALIERPRARRLNDGLLIYRDAELEATAGDRDTIDRAQ